MVSLQQEGQTMDRLQNRLVQGQPQRGPSEARKSQDTVAKSYPKSAYKREVSSSKYDPISRNAANQKAKCFDKRQMLHGRNTEGRRTQAKLELGTWDVAFDSERPKKRDINHWINLHTKPREEYDYEQRPSTKVQKYNMNEVRNLIATEAHDYNKEEFLQANCQFVVRTGEDYSMYFVNPDKLVDWNFIEQIILHSVENNNCPICQEPPVAGKITRCGHVLCSVCVLRYLQVTGRSWAKCPICSESIHANDVKSVKVLVRKGPSVGEEVVLQLMRREVGTMVFSPVSEASSKSSPDQLLSVNKNINDTVYSKLLQANTKEIMAILEDEENALNEQLKEYEGTPEIVFVEEAIENLRERKEMLLAISVIDEEDNELEEKSDVIEEAALIEPDGGDDKMVEEDNVKDEEDPQDPKPRKTQSTQKKYCYFYQATDGQRIFLHSLNIKMLEMQFGSLGRSPHFLKGVILEKDYGSMTLKLRKRLRYLQHLPVTSEFEIVELDLPQDVISPSVVNSFRDQLQERAKIRAKRMKEEMNRERKMRIADMEKAELEFVRYVAQPTTTTRYRLDSWHEFPECGADTPPFATSSESSNVSIEDNDDFPALAQSMDSLSMNNTFAQKLKDGKKSTRSVMEPRDYEEAGPSHSYSLGDAVEAALQMASQGVIQKRGGKKKKRKSVSISTSGIIGRIGN